MNHVRVTLKVRTVFILQQTSTNFTYIDTVYFHKKKYNLLAALLPSFHKYLGTYRIG